MTKTLLLGASLMFVAGLPLTSLAAQSLTDRVIDNAAQLEQKAIGWRHDIHQHPELGNQETRTAALIAEHLRQLGMTVETDVGTTGVVAMLKGGKPGPVVALRADMDALPVAENTGLAYASAVKQEYLGKSMPVMHACGHDAHVAILMAVAENLAAVREELSGSVKFIFQPAEEGPSDYVYDGERYFGARLMVEEGVLENPAVDAIFGLHVTAAAPTGVIGYRSGPTMASSGDLHITVTGKQTHGAQPWNGVDPIVASAQIITGLQTVVSRRTDIMPAPAVVTIGTIEGGTRHNIIPDKVKMTGTVRTFDDEVQKEVNAQITQTAEHIALSSGATAEVTIVENYATTVNEPDLTARMLPTLQRVTDGRTFQSPLVTGSEDFSYFAQKVPGLFFFLGVTPAEKLGRAAPNHSPEFLVDDKALLTGIKALSALTTDYLQAAD
ncbi:amidohydrolase [Halopseudomonas pelagia]|uniref:Amidohydrolase n=1 Tax=Halopseudomonas pelagia TaxID=553151 RepID=A0AA91Z5T8_9GAMM|nr:amidohydrolase [Halopseudomonas pelagia]PCC99121.1 N-acyl-L-amino acid amidohydrolase [Halopseudomonas pelagia]QFY58499.1 amidohydrolase [Halopseudomonas pelagia]